MITIHSLSWRCPERCSERQHWQLLRQTSQTPSKMILIKIDYQRWKRLCVWLWIGVMFLDAIASLVPTPSRERAFCRNESAREEGGISISRWTIHSVYCLKRNILLRVSFQSFFFCNNSQTSQTFTFPSNVFYIDAAAGNVECCNIRQLYLGKYQN